MPSSDEVPAARGYSFDALDMTRLLLKINRHIGERPTSGVIE